MWASCELDETLLEDAELYENYRYARQGRDETGLDCVGVVWKFHTEHGLWYAERSDYGPRWFQFTPRLLIDSFMAAGFVRVPAGKLRRLDVLVFRVFTCVGDHPGVYLGGDRFLHGLGNVQVQRLSRWESRLAEVLRPTERLFNG